MAMDTKSFGGIDPGFSGCLAIIRPDGTVQFHDPPVVALPLAKKSKAGNVRHRSEYLFAEMAKILREARLDFVTLEKTVPMPSFKGGRMVQMPAASAFGSGVGYGMYQMGLATLGIPYQLVSPATWKAGLLAGQPKTKEGAVAYAARLYPGASSSLYGPRGGILDGRAEALLLARYEQLGLR